MYHGAQDTTTGPLLHPPCGRGRRRVGRATGHGASAAIAQTTLIHGWGSVVMVSSIQVRYSS